MPATAAGPGPLDQTGTLHGANYRIIVPANWNGGLVVLAHGYRDRADHTGEVDDTSPMDVGFTGIAGGLASQGYAVAASAYKTNGWAVSDELEDTVSLTSYFRDTIAWPDRTLLVGFSLASFSVKLAERTNGLFDGFLPACGVLAGAPRAWDGAGVNLLAYSTAFGGMPASWGTVPDGDDDVDFETEVASTLIGQISNPANFGRFEFMRRVSGVPVQHEAAYLETVTAAGRTDLLRQVYTTGTTHCGFTPTQIFYSIGQFDQWVQTGTAPSAASFPAALGYVPGYTPAPWPQP